jgi:RES domain-containing protein
VTSADFKSALAAYPASRLEVFGTRFSHERHRRTILSPVHSGFVGNRYNPPGINALYFGLARATALAEYTHNFLDTDPLYPCSMVTAMIGIDRHIELTDLFLAFLGLISADVCQHYRVDKYARTQQLGKFAHDENIQAIVYPSSADQADVAHRYNLLLTIGRRARNA